MNRKKLEKKIREKKKKQKKKKHTYTYLYAGESKLSYGQAAVASVRSGNSNSQPQLTRETSTAHAGKLPRGKHRRNVPVRTFGREESRHGTNKYELKHLQARSPWIKESLFFLRIFLKKTFFLAN